MNKVIFFLFYLFGLQWVAAQEFEGSELLDKAIAYHDPQSKWKTFKGDFTVTMETPNRPLRKSNIRIDFPASFFKLEVQQQGNTLVSTLDNEACHLTFNGATDFSESIQKEYRFDCERANFYKNYYTYLYGLPMKLKNPGTLINSKVNKERIDGKAYWVLKVNYREEVGTDTWYFYFDQNTYALKRYQFYHDESKNDGEYIVLEGELDINGIKMPKNRSWYYNSNDQFLGIDRLTN
ncbi:DUF6503 family protein [Flavobacteriaceae bacterium]|jgi:hypothetical protein|nr:DUF6503 family protein [Flavobacteriaceae bacterium]MDA9038026.1 DUF6503 family protein [Flavobacteriaceae bacterium]MDA9587819.1 DUF6503 family protein [Flavobacteriaceae bacterium]